MAQKPKTRGATNKVRSAAKQKAQSERFIETARKLGVDESGREFERALRKITPLKARGKVR